MRRSDCFLGCVWHCVPVWRVATVLDAAMRTVSARASKAEPIATEASCFATVGPVPARRSRRVDSPELTMAGDASVRVKAAQPVAVTACTI